MSDFWSSLFSGFLGGGLISLITTLWTIKEKNKSEKRADDQNILQSIISIRGELNSVYNRYNEHTGILFENTIPKQAPIIFLPINEEYFPIYKNNTSAIGKIKRKSTIENVISCYTCAAGMIDSIKLNNSFYDQHSKLTLELLSCPSEEQKNIIHSKILIIEQNVHEYWEKLRKHHFELHRIASLAYTGMSVEIEMREEALKS